jgi:cytochrome c oxidase assembly protein subunit 15
MLSRSLWRQQPLMTKLNSTKSVLKSPFLTKRFYSETPVKSVVSKPVVAYWLYFNAGLVYAIVVVGGLTRLTESGLSITEWNVISGMKPPRSEEEWEEEFEKYKQFPEYKM